MKDGKLLTVVVETSKPETAVRLCFNREIKEGKRCYRLILSNRGLQLRKIPLAPPQVDYRRP